MSLQLSLVDYSSYQYGFTYKSCVSTGNNFGERNGPLRLSRYGNNISDMTGIRAFVDGSDDVRDFLNGTESFSFSVGAYFTDTYSIRNPENVKVYCAVTVEPISDTSSGQNIRDSLNRETGGAVYITSDTQTVKKGTGNLIGESDPLNTTKFTFVFNRSEMRTEWDNWGKQQYLYFLFWLEPMSMDGQYDYLFIDFEFWSSQPVTEQGQPSGASFIENGSNYYYYIPPGYGVHSVTYKDLGINSVPDTVYTNQQFNFDIVSRLAETVTAVFKNGEDILAETSFSTDHPMYTCPESWLSNGDDPFSLSRTITLEINDTTGRTANAQFTLALPPLSITPSSQTTADGSQISFSIGNRLGRTVNVICEYQETQIRQESVSDDSVSFTFTEDDFAGFGEEEKDSFVLDIYALDNDGREAFCTLEVRMHPVITVQPTSLTINDGETAVFAVEAYRGDINYHWIVRNAGNNEWWDLYTDNINPLMIQATYDKNGNQYACAVSNQYLSRYTNFVTLTVTPVAPSITEQPHNIVALADNQIQLSVSASGTSPVFQWQYYDTLNTEWRNVDGESASASTLSLEINPEMDGRRFRCVVSNMVGSEISDEATVSVYDRLHITASPENCDVVDGELFSFSVTATWDERCPEPRYVWYRRDDDGLVTQVDGNHGRTLTLVATPGLDASQYMCRLEMDEPVAMFAESDYATLTVISIPVFDIHPSTGEADEDSPLLLSVHADGKRISYQWQIKRAGAEEWEDAPGGNGYTLSITAHAGLDGARFRCLASNTAGETYSDEAELHVVITPFALVNGVTLPAGVYTFCPNDSSGEVQYDICAVNNNGDVTESLFTGASGAQSFELSEETTIRITLSRDRDGSPFDSIARPMLETGRKAHVWVSPTLDYDHDTANDFNYGWFSIGNTYGFKENVVTASMPCEMTIRYRPIWRDTL